MATIEDKARSQVDVTQVRKGQLAAMTAKKTRPSVEARSAVLRVAARRK